MLNMALLTGNLKFGVFIKKNKQKKSRLSKTATRLGEEVMKNHFGFSYFIYRLVWKKL